jgi:dephospho-CoA kinase
MNRTRVVGVIGAVGAGKSTVARRLAELGGRLIDGDAVGHQVLKEPLIRNQVIEKFGVGIVGENGEIDRRKLGALVFSDSSKLDSLERIMHPRMKAIFAEKIAAAQDDPNVKLVVFDAAILLEAGWGDMMDDILYVDADRPSREARVQSRGWSPAELARREVAQWPAERKKACADFIIVNDHWEARRWEVDALFRRWTAAESTDSRGDLAFVPVSVKDQ